MFRTARFKAIVALIIANIIWGVASPFFKWSLTNIPPFALAFFRFGLAAIILSPFVFKSIKNLKLVDLPRIFLFSLFGVTMNISFFFLGLNLAPSINAALIGSTQPLFLLVIGALLLKENVEPREILGTTIAFLGVLLIIFFPLIINGYQAETASLGNLFFVLATIGAVGQPLIGKQLFKKYPPLPITFMAFLIGALSFIPFLIYEGLQNPFWVLNLQTPGLAGILFGAIFSSLLAYSLYDWGLSKIEVSETGIYSYLIPITAVIVAISFFGEKLSLQFALAAFLILLGIALTQITQKKAP